MKRGLKSVIVVAIVILTLVAAIYFTFLSYKKCSDEVCFKSYQTVCKKADFLKETDEATWYFKILGKSGEDCKIYVQLAQLKKGEVRSEVMQGKDMDCLLKMGSTESPEGNLKVCHGELKEEMQDLIIQKMYSYLLENLGEVKQGFNGI